MKYQDFFSEKLEEIKKEGRYRIFRSLERIIGKAPYAYWHDKAGIKEVIVWCGNDYLTMGHNATVVDAVSKSLHKYGVGSGGTRNISGTHQEHLVLEKIVASFHKKESALLFTSGYVANESTLSCLGALLPNCVFFSDERNHASIIAGIRHSGCERYVFRHNDMEHLARLLKATDFNRPKIIACVSIYSMDGDRANLFDICALAKKYNALIFLDEVHAIGIYGPEGEGAAAERGLSDEIDIIQGNFAKACGSIGGYITGSDVLVDCVRSYAPAFIFTTSLPPLIAVAAKESLNVLRKATCLRKKLWENVSLMRAMLEKSFIEFKRSDTHIIPLMVRNAHECQEISSYLLETYRHYLQPINYPTVPRGSECLRLTVTPAHTKEMMISLLDALERTWKLYKRSGASDRS